ncbi:hypothetical protein [Clostridium disporicum]|uniref:hypothetical protein n=1 Tax=Clostridium disporicum TaxID=84024 RepID=UPI0034A58CBF
MENKHNLFDNLDVNEFEQFINDSKNKNWSGTDEENEFLSFLLNYVHNNEDNSISSDEFYYSSKDLANYNFREVENYLFKLNSAVSNYAMRNYIDTNVDVDCTDIFTQTSCVLKFKDNFYLIQHLVGQGSVVIFKHLTDNDCLSYVEYDLLINDEPSPNYKKDLERMVFSQLERLREGLNVDGELFVQLLDKYAQNSLKGV